MPITPHRRLDDIRRQIAQWRGAGERIAFVPTMGALHAGHMSLVEAAKLQADRVVVSIFVNPKQFGPNEDFSAYPRPLEADLALCEAHGVDAVFAPEVAEMYPEGFATEVHVNGPMTGVLCGASRPGHFDGVATVVSKLLLQVMPDVALFGEKDFQQLQVIRRFVADLDIPVEIAGVPISREEDGLARSSRNVYLTPPERVEAVLLYRTLMEMRARLLAGEALIPVLAEGRNTVAHAFGKLDYLDLRRERDLADALHLPAGSHRLEPFRLFVAARVGKARLIDNLAL